MLESDIKASEALPTGASEESIILFRRLPMKGFFKRLL